MIQIHIIALFITGPHNVPLIHLLHFFIFLFLHIFNVCVRERSTNDCLSILKAIGKGKTTFTEMLVS